MKKFKFLCSQNGWEYAGEMIIEAEVIKYFWAGDAFEYEYYKHNYPDSAGNTIVADGVTIHIDEHFEYKGEVL